MKIRVAQVITRLEWGGAPDIVRVLCGRLDPRVFDVTLITGPGGHMSGKTRDFLSRFGGTVLVVPSLKRDIDPVADSRALAALYRVFAGKKFDIVHTHTAKAGALGRVAARMAKVPAVVHTPHGHNFYGYFGLAMTAAVIRIERFLARYADKIITLTELEKADYLRLGVAPAEKLTVIYQGLELGGVRVYADRARAMRIFGADEGGQIVGMIGRLEHVKGAGYFIGAAGIVAARKPETKFVIIGEGSLRAELEGRAAGAGLGGNVIFTGWRDDASDLIPAFTVLALPSLNEAVGIVLIEAQAQGVPVVATNVGGIPEVVKDGETGILVGPADEPAMAEAILSLLDDRERREAMGRRAKEWVGNRFNADDMARRTASLYTELLAAKAAKPS